MASTVEPQDMPRRGTSLRASLAGVIDEKVVPRRYYFLAVVAALYAWNWLALTSGWGADWYRFMAVGRSFSTVAPGGDVFPPVMLVLLYPFTFLGLRTGWIVCSTICMALGLVTIWCIERTAAVAGVGSRRIRERAVVVGGLFLIYAWALPGARWGHADDIVALTGVALACLAVAQGRWVLASLAIAVAIDAKPWAALVLPLAATCEGRRARGLALAVIVAALPWVPFYFIQDGHLAALNLPVTSWARPVQLAAALPLGAYAVARHRWFLVPAVGFAVRINLDPVTVPYYTAGAVLGLFLWDVMRPLRLQGARTALGCLALVLVPSYFWGAHGYNGAEPLVIGLRLAAAIPPIALLFGMAIPAPVTNKMSASAEGSLKDP
jgi:hypothetical protein